MSKPKPPQPNPIAASWTWGSSSQLRLDAQTPPGLPPFTAPVASAQLAQVSLPEPAVCTFYLQASMRTRYIEDELIAFSVDLIQGLGRVAIPRVIAFGQQPAVGKPLEYTLPFIPVHALQVMCSANAEFRSGQPDREIIVEMYFALSPLTRIQQRQQELSFGMALPGEADDLDDELRSELEAEGPTVEAMMHQLHGGGRDDDDDDDDDDDGEALAARVTALLTRRLGRRPSRFELRRALARLAR